jgi:flagellar biosynthesis/type III secretory pathway chaperone
MSRQVFELEQVLQAMIDEHTKLLGHVDRHQAAMRALDHRSMEDLVRLQESARLRIATLETKRRALIQTIARGHRMTQTNLTVSDIANLYPPSSAKLNKLRGELRALIEQLQAKTHIAGRLATAVLGHLNTVVRLLAGAVEKAGLYTKSGTPQVSTRIGVMEAVG